MNYSEKKKSFTEKILKLFSHKLNKIEKRQMYLFILMILFFISQIFQTFYFKYTIDKKITNEVQEKETIEKKKIVFLGDSITEMYDLQKYFHNKDYVNSGISGHTTSNILSHIKDRAVDYNPKQIFLLIGVNDQMTRDLENTEAIENIENIIIRLQDLIPDTELYIESILPVNHGDDEKINHDIVDERKNKNINVMNDEIKKLCEKYNVTYINLHDKFTDEDGNLKLEYTKEGLHLSNKGYEVMTQELKKYL